MKHYCGIVAFADNDADRYIIRSLQLLQHRGHDSAGISYVHNNDIITYKRLGLVNKVFKNYTSPPFILGIGHVRYSTIVDKDNAGIYIQPFYSSSRLGKYSLAHNGNIPNIAKYAEEFNIELNHKSDTAILIEIINELSKTHTNWREILINLINLIPGAYSLVILTKNSIYALKDRYGIRPLCVGKHPTGGKCITSESRALQDFKLMRELDAGELVHMDKTGFLSTLYKKKSPDQMFCSFEHIYFFKPETIYRNESVKEMRYKCGYYLGIDEKEALTDIVTCMPSTAIPSGQGFANALNITFYQDYIKKASNQFVYRTFILPNNKKRLEACKIKFNIDAEKMKGKDIYIIDDSIVRSNTMKTMIKRLRDAGINKIHVRIVSPPIISSCYYGIDMADKDELIAANRSVEEVRQIIDADTLKYIDIDVMKKIFKVPLCTSCFTGQYNKDILDW